MTDSYSAEEMAALRQKLEAHVLDWPAVSGRRMFGCPSYFAGNTIFAVLVTGNVALTRLNEEQRARLATHFPARPFDSGRGLVHKWAVVPFATAAELEPLLPFLEQSYQNALAEESR